jgi:ATP-dependent helicase HrpB
MKVSGDVPDADEAILRAIFAAFPDRLVRRREPGSPRGVMVGGRGVTLGPSSAVMRPELFVCVDIDAGGTESLVREASMVRREWLSPELVTSAIEVSFVEESESVTARKRTRFDDLIIDDSHASFPSGDRSTRVLAEAAMTRLDRVLPSNDSDAGRFLVRVRCLREWMPELDLPAFSEADLKELLVWVCQGRKSFAEVREGPWLEMMQSKLDQARLRALDREAPETFEVPSGSNIRLQYEVGRPPILAVRIQELFGLAETPRIAAGRVKVLLHLLAPNHRPQQVTDDLASFWENAYPIVRRELRGRYPKHAWPNNPLEALPERRPRKKSG